VNIDVIRTARLVLLSADLLPARLCCHEIIADRRMGVCVVLRGDPVVREARVYRQDGSLSVHGNDDSLNGEDVLPGFICPLQDILKRYLAY